MSQADGTVVVNELKQATLESKYQPLGLWEDGMMAVEVGYQSSGQSPNKSIRLFLTWSKKIHLHQKCLRKRHIDNPQTNKQNTPLEPLEKANLGWDLYGS